MLTSLRKCLASFFGLGFLPWFPGTWGSLAAVLIYMLTTSLSGWITGFFCLFFWIFGWLASSESARDWGQEDASCIVIDEVAAMYTLLILGFPKSLVGVLTLFVLFRVFDIVKLWPARKIQNEAPHAWGIMGDDAAAAIHAGLVFALLQLGAWALEWPLF
jgi:phosphatidylglycerophosphatase A